MQDFLSPTSMIDSDNAVVRNYAHQVAGSCHNAVEKAVQLYLAVRDGIRYDPYAPFYRPEHYRAGYVMARGKSFCIPKASLLCALGRACEIPSRIGFAIVRNHLATKQLLEFLGFRPLRLPWICRILPGREMGQGNTGLQQGTLSEAQGYPA